MRILLCLLTLHAACDGPTEPTETEETTAGETATESGPEAGDEAAPRGGLAAEPTPPPSTEPWATIVSSYVTEDGGFRYAALAESEPHREALARYVEAIGAATDEGWSDAEALAFYVNAYNALTVAAVLEAWPIESVMRVEGFFDTKTHQVAGEAMTLNGLENDIIRSERFADPRIHFVVNCASKSCPPLAAEPYTAENVEAMMAAASQAYVRATTELTSRKVKVSRLFEWFAEDFGGASGVRAFVADQLEDEAAAHVRNERTELGYRDYDWALNDRPEPAEAEEATEAD
jgi:hypothetical protein